MQAAADASCVTASTSRCSLSVRPRDGASDSQAIFAHELRRELHGDTAPAALPVRERELSADRIDAYSLERLGIRRLEPTEVTACCQLMGDDFSGGDGTHGSGAERASAFEDGWHRAALGLREQVGESATGLGESRTLKDCLQRLCAR